MMQRSGGQAWTSGRRWPCRAALALVLGVAGCGGGGGGGEPLLVFGRAGTGVGEFSYPRAIALGAGRVYVVDKSARIQCFDERGRHLLEWSTPARDAGKPVGLGVGPDGRVYVADTHYARVLIYTATGELAGSFGGYGTAPGQFGLTTDVVVAADGTVFVGEYGGNDRVTKFSPQLQPLATFGARESGEARLARPQGLLLTPDGTVWVADSCNHRLCRFGSDGTYQGSIGRLGRGPGELRFPYGVDRLSDGSLVVVEYGNNRVQRLTTDGRSLGAWGTAGRSPGQLASPWALAADGRDRVWIVDGANNRVQVIDGARASTWTPIAP